MDELDIRSRIESRSEHDANNGYAEVVVAVKTGDAIKVYEGLANSIDFQVDESMSFWTDGSQCCRPLSGYDLSIHFVGSIREGNG